LFIYNQYDTDTPQPPPDLRNFKESKKVTKIKRTLNFSLREWKRNEPNEAEKYWWATTYPTGLLRCDRSRSNV
jgi:hypothetical protein